MGVSTIKWSSVIIHGHLIVLVRHKQAQTCPQNAINKFLQNLKKNFINNLLKFLPHGCLTACWSSSRKLATATRVDSLVEMLRISWQNNLSHYCINATVLALIFLYDGHCSSVCNGWHQDHGSLTLLGFPDHVIMCSNTWQCFLILLCVFCNRKSTERVLELLHMVNTDDLKRVWPLWYAN